MADTHKTVLSINTYIHIFPTLLNTIESDSIQRNNNIFQSAKRFGLFIKPTYLLYSTDDGLMNRLKHALQIEKYCRVSSYIYIYIVPQ